MEKRETAKHYKQSIYDMIISFFIGVIFIIVSSIGAYKNNVFDIIYFLKTLFRFCYNAKNIRLDALNDALKLIQMVTIDFILILLIISGIGIILGNLLNLEKLLTKKQDKECLFYKVFIMYMLVFAILFYVPGAIVISFFVISILLAIGYSILFFSGILVDILGLLNIHIVVIKLLNYILSVFTKYRVEISSTLVNSKIYTFIAISLLIFTYLGYPIIKRTFDFMIWIVEKTNKRNLNKIKSNFIYVNFIKLFSINKLRGLTYVVSFIIYIMSNSYSFNVYEFILNEKIPINVGNNMMPPQNIIKEALLTFIIADTALYIIYDYIQKKKENKIQIEIARTKNNYEIIKKIKLLADFDNINKYNEKRDLKKNHTNIKSIIISIFEKIVYSEFDNIYNLEGREKNKINYIKEELLKIDTKITCRKKYKDERLNKINEIDSMFIELKKCNTYTEIIDKIDDIILYLKNIEFIN